ncbi:Riean_0653 family protein [Hymenobacter ruber]
MGDSLSTYSIDAAPANTPGNYSLNLSTGIGEVLYSSGGVQPCGFMYDSRDVTYRKATLNITRFDINSRIIAGTFDAIIARTGCDTLKITQGRFDAKF